ncbi:hypothetical protein L596_026867 [Steinernema carpocapsae]|uniref:Uncharacterized protein n=1 Tax=Steinernema carpocapsae TaxID=34508 RepID=A0A4V5ZYB9_STECR|nr:hypothetical protein L596_026867 [Steinernema carpocapsae]
MASAIRRFFYRAYAPKNLLMTNTVTMVSLLGLGDYIQQRFQGDKWDWRRSGLILIESLICIFSLVRFAAIGFVIGPMNHQWYKYLDSRVVGKRLKLVVAKKVAADFLISPVFASTFIAGVAMLEGKSVSVALKEYKSKFFHVLALDFCVWPPTQAINFAFVPASCRVLFISIVTLFHNCFMSYIKHNELSWY